MRVVRFGALLMLSVLAGCAARRPPAATAVAPAVAPPVASQRSLVETPPPAPIPDTPLPALKPGTELSLAESEALANQASPKGPPVEGDPTASQKAMGRMAAQTASQPGASQQAASETPAGQASASQLAAGQTSANQPAAGQTSVNQPAAGQAPASQPAANPPAASQPAGSHPVPSLTANSVPAGGAGAPAVPDAAHLVGLSQSEATALFGSPAESKDLPPSKIWTYHSPVCDMKLFFYPEVGGPNFRALTYQIDERGASDATHNACLSSLAKPHAG
jgi:hypothetical protein